MRGTSDRRSSRTSWRVGGGRGRSCRSGRREHVHFEVLARGRRHWSRECVYAFRPLSLVGQPALFHVTPDARFPPGRARLDDPFEVVDPAFERVLVDCECARVGAEHEGYGRGGVFAKARAFAGFGAPFDDEVLEYLGEAGVFHDRGDGGGGAGSVDLVGAAKEAEDRGQVDGQQRFERGSEAGARGDEFERGPAEGAAFGDYASDEGFGGSRVAQEGDKVVGELCGCASSDDGLEAFQCAIDLFPGIFSLVEGEDSLQVLSLCTQVAQGRDGTSLSSVKAWHTYSNPASSSSLLLSGRVLDPAPCSTRRHGGQPRCWLSTRSTRPPMQQKQP